MLGYRTTSQLKPSTRLDVDRSYKSIASHRKDRKNRVWHMYCIHVIWLVRSFFPPIELPTPENVIFVKSNTTSIEISWKQFTLVELKALANYTVTYSAASASNVATTINIPWTENGITITKLNSGTLYDITVSITTLSRISGMFTYFYFLHWLALSPDPLQLIKLIMVED